MIHIDEESAFETAQPRALNAIALQHDDRVIVAFEAREAPDRWRAGESAIDEGHRIGGDQIGVLAQLSQHHPAGQHGADGIAIGPRVRADGEALTAADHLLYGSKSFTLAGDGNPSSSLLTRRDVVACRH